jgi:DNA-binding response OmpR family regulator
MACERILVVDDDEGDRCLMLQVLRAEGYCVEEATSAERAFEKIDSARPHLVITKSSTRGIGGLALVRRIRAGVDGQLPILMYTPISAQAQLEALQAGVNDFLTRPFRQTELIARTRALLSIRQAQCETAELKRTLYTGAAERARREWEAIFNAINDAIVITDAEGRITRVNHAAGRLFDQDADEISGSRCANLLDRNTVCPHYSLSEFVPSVEVECPSRRADLQLMIRAQRITDASGTPVSFAHVLRATAEVTRGAASSLRRSAYTGAAPVGRNTTDVGQVKNRTG